MHIPTLKNFNISTSFSNPREYPIYKNTLNIDTISFGSLSRKQKQYKLKQELRNKINKEKLNKKFNPKENLQLQNALRKKFINPEVKKAIIKKRLPEQLLNKIVKRLEKYPNLLSELFLEPSGGGLILSVPEKTMQKICNNIKSYRYFTKLALSKDFEGKTFIDKASDSQIVIFNTAAKNYPEVLKVLYTTPRENNMLPAHFIPPKALESMNKVLAPYPDIINYIYKSSDINGNTPAHNRLAYGQWVIANLFKHNLPLANYVYNKPNNIQEYFDSTYTKAEEYKGPFKKTWEYIFNNL